MLGAGGFVALEHELLVLAEQQRVGLALDRLGGHDHLADVGARGDLVHDVEEDLLDDRAQAASAGLALRGAGRGREQTVIGELELDLVDRQELLVLLHDRVLRLGEDAQQVRFIQRLERNDDRHAADELGDEAVLEEVVGHDLGKDGGRLLRVLREGRAEAHRLLADARLHDLLEALERAAEDEEDVRGVDLDEVLVRMLAAALRRDVRDGALEDLEERLLHALAGDVAGDRRVVALARDLVDLVDVDDPSLRAVQVEVGRLDEPKQDVLDVLADVAGLGEARRVGDGERHVEDAREGLREERLATAGRADEQDVRLPELDVVHAVPGADALVVVVDGDREDALGLVLADDVLVEDLVDPPRAGDLGAARARLRRLHELFVDDLAAERDALVADVNALAGDELAHLVLRLAAEGAAVRLAALGRSGHR